MSRRFVIAGRLGVAVLGTALVMAVFAARVAAGGRAPETTCGDDVCDASESCATCSEDCGSCPFRCGNGVLEPGEGCDDSNTTGGDGCSAACLLETGCGDGACTGAEGCVNCSADCGVCACGNGLCEATEDCGSCPDDCGGCACGDGLCDPSESCSGCPADCGVCPVCGDRLCAEGETCAACPGDCGVCVCGNGLCEPNENCGGCPDDCGSCPVCDDGICAPGEACGEPFHCAEDCGPCGPTCVDGTCDPDESCSTCPRDCGSCTSVCGNGLFEPSGEGCDDGNTVPGDGCSAGCALETACGDGACSGAEDCSTCTADCGLCVCGNGACEAFEGCGSCPADCGACVCGDGICLPVEGCGTCPQDCGPCDVCGDGVCGEGETCATCDIDCGPCVCGNGTCQPGEDCASCPGDCGACPTCGDARCDAGESCRQPFACLIDCPRCSRGCGDGVCASSESCLACPTDCGTCPSVCGNGLLEPDREQCDDGNNLAGDGCGPTCLLEGVCGDSACGAGESCVSCPGDCGQCICGNDICEQTEGCGGCLPGGACTDCPQDCGPCFDADRDGVMDVPDCSPRDPGAFAPPGDVAGIDLSGAAVTTLSWESQAALAGAGTRFDVMSGDTLGFPTWLCRAAGVDIPESSFQGDPPLGRAIYWLVRARNRCGVATFGSIGLDLASACGVCGNGVRELWEECDDGNTREADGCSPGCLLE